MYALKTGICGQQVEDINAVRFGVYPTRVQQQVLKRWIGAQRYIYNQRFQEPDETFCPWDQAFSKYQQSAPWLEEIPSFVRRDGCARFRDAMSQWGQGLGRPQVKTRKSRQ